MLIPLHRRSVTSVQVVDFLQRAMDAAHVLTARWSPAQVLRLPDLQINLLTRNHHYAALVAERLFCAGFDRRFRERITVAVLSPLDSPLPSPPAWGDPIFHPRQFETQLRDTPFRATYFHDCGLWQIYDRNRKFGLQWMMGPRSYPDWEPGAPLRVFLHWAYGLQGKRLTHAGTLGKRNRGLLLVGKGGSGKSGTVVAGILHGLQSVGDDYVLIDHDGAKTAAYPLFRMLKQDTSGLERLGLGKTIAATRVRNWQNKYEFGSEELGGRPFIDRLSIRAMVIPRIAATDRSIITPIAKHQAMLAIAPSGLFQMPGERDSGVQFYSQLVRQMPCFQMALSCDPADISRTLRTFIERGFRCV